MCEKIAGAGRERDLLGVEISDALKIMLLVMFSALVGEDAHP